MLRFLFSWTIVTLLAGCRGGESVPQRRTLIDSRDTDDPGTLDPALATDVPKGRAVSYVFDGLTRFTADARLEPALAERWEVSPDGRSYTFHLRRGVRFHDGTPFVARQVVRSYQRVLDPRTHSGGASFLLPIAGARAFLEGKAASVSGLEAVDDSTVRITLDRPVAFFPTLLALPVASVLPDSVGADFGQRPVGTGPWRLVEWRHDDFLLFARNDAYYAGAPEADSLMARIIPEPSTAVAEFERGNVDLLFVPEDQTSQWEQADEKKALLASAPGLRLWYVGINVTRGPLTDRRVRQAINHAVDVRTVLDRIMGGRGRRAAGVIPLVLPGADSARAPYAYDPARARQLLSEAGLPNGIDVQLWHSATAPSPRLAQAIQGYLSAAGIRATLVQREAASVRQAARKGETDLIVKDWFADYPDGENFLYPLLHTASSTGGPNVSYYSNPAFDQLVDRAKAEPNDERRAALYRQADSLSFVDAPMVYLFFYDQLFAVQPWVEGFEVPTIFNGQRWERVTIGTGNRGQGTSGGTRE